MNSTFMNSKNSKTSDSSRLLLNLTEKVDLKRKDYILVYQILSCTIPRKI